MDNDSVETDTALVHVDLDGTVTSVCLGLYTVCQSVLFKNHFCLSTGEISMVCMAASSAHGLGFSPACTEKSVLYTSAPYAEYGDGIPVQHYAEPPPFGWAYYGKNVSISLTKQAKGFQCIGIGSVPRNWIPDTGASSHFTPCLMDLKEVKEG
jgi:hypothetical protein